MKALPVDVGRVLVTVPFCTYRNTCLARLTSIQVPEPLWRGTGRTAVVSRVHVPCPTAPSRPRPSHFWKAMTALRVRSSKTPSTVPGL